MSDWQDPILRALEPERPVLIAGPTASGKSDLALRIAETQGGTVVNADAIQVYADWQILTARPGPNDVARAPHALYGHVPGTHAYSVGDWLRQVRPLLSEKVRPILVGGTGLYFSALTEGLADIPPTPDEIRSDALRRMATDGAEVLLSELDAETARRIDRKNPMRIQRAWEVLAATGRGLAEWQDETCAPPMPLERTHPIVLRSDRDWLARRIERRVGLMMDAGLLEEARRNRPNWRPDLPSSKAIGATELMAFLDGTLSQQVLTERLATLTRQYAKRQRSWFRSRMSRWSWHACH